MHEIAEALLKQNPWVKCEITRQRGRLDVECFDQTYFLFTKKKGKAEEFWFENEGGNASYPVSDFKSALISLLTFAFERKLRTQAFYW
jgi:hypothetical protein